MAQQSEIRDEVHRKIGRNLLLIQVIEAVLKRLIALNGLKVKTGGSNLDERLAAINKTTMGNLVGEYHDIFFAEQGGLHEDDEDVQEVQLSVRFRFASDELLAQSRKSFSSIVDERNKLVHHFLQELNVGAKGWEDADQKLEKQYKELTNQFKHLRSVHDALRKTVKKALSEERIFEDSQSEELNS